MAWEVGVVMDPIAAIKPWKDTTLALLLEARRRGHRLRYMEIPDLAVRDGRALAHMRPLEVADDNERWYRLGEPETRPLAALDLILMRKDPPVDPAYLHATHILGLAEAAGARVVNRPWGLREAHEKLFAARFPECIPPTLVSADAAAIRAFIAEQGRAVLKPLDAMGGASIFVLAAGDPNTTVVIETLTGHGAHHLVAQRYLPEIRDGDKRIVMIGGEPYPRALARIPREGETRGNLAAGGRGVGVELSERDRWICAQVAPALREHGLDLAGLDVIGDHLTEVNVTSPTCLRELDAIYETSLSALLFDHLEGRPAA